jgi:MFS family permease
MLIAACVFASLLSVPLAGGRLSALADLRFRHVWLVATALAIQVLVISIVPAGGGWTHEALHIVSYLLGGAFVIANRHVPFLWLAGGGGLLNFTAIAANGGVMPASADALRTAGLHPEAGFVNSGALPDSRLAFLGDIFAVPADWPLSNVFSVGDICLLLGLLLLLHRVGDSRLMPRASEDLSALRRNPTFARLWLAQAISHLGDWIYTITAVTVVARSTGTAEALAVLLIMQLGPAALVGALGGPLVDRRSRRGLMIAADLFRATAVASLLLAGGPSPGHLWVVAACLGGFGALFGPSLQASLPNILPAGQLVAANAVLSTTFTFAVTTGPLIGAFAVAQLGAAPAFAFNAGSFVLSALLIVAARLPATPASTGTNSPARDLAEGVHYIARTPVARALLLSVALVMLGGAIKTPLEPLFVLETLAARPEALGLVGASWGLGMIIGAAVSPEAARRYRRETLLWTAIAVVGVAILTASRMTSLVWVLLLWLIGGAANAIGGIAQETLLQERTPDAVRGRVFAAADALTDGAFLLGAVAAGTLGLVLGIRGALVASGAVALLAAFVSRALLTSGRPHASPKGERLSTAAPAIEVRRADAEAGAG